MILSLKYNDIIHELSLEFDDSLGEIQEKILHLLHLVIYQMEHTIFIFDNREYILGLYPMTFNRIFKDFLMEENIIEINNCIVIDKVSILNMNSEILNNYQIWYQHHENQNYIQSLNNPDPIRFEEEVNNITTLLEENLNFFEPKEIVRDVLDENEFLTLENHEFHPLYKHKQCSICLHHFHEKSTIVKLECGHIFDRGCIGLWLKQYNRRCPTCRRIVSNK